MALDPYLSNTMLSRLSIRPLGSLVSNHSDAPFVVHSDPPPADALAPLCKTVLEWSKAAVVKGVLGDALLAAPDSLERLVADRVNGLREDKRNEARARMRELAQLPVDKRRLELGDWAEALDQPEAFTQLQVPSAITEPLLAELGRLVNAGPDERSRLIAELGLRSMSEPKSRFLGSPLPLAASHLHFEMDWIRCDVETTGYGDDEVLGTALGVRPDGTAWKLDLGRLDKVPGEQEEGFYAGRVVDPSPDRVIASFPIPPQGPWPMGFGATIILVEQDYGNFPELVETIYGLLAGMLTEWARREAALAVGEGLLGTLTGGVTAVVVGYVLVKLLNWIESAWEDDLIAAHEFVLQLEAPIVAFDNGSQYVRQETIFAGDGGQYTLAWAWHVEVDGVVRSFTTGPFEIIEMVRESYEAAHPQVDIDMPPGFKVIGGGARANWKRAGNLLTAAYPASSTRWSVASKDHLISDPCKITAYAYGARLRDGSPIPDEHYRIIQCTSALVQHPHVSAPCPAEFSVMGGGAKVNYSEPGNLLTASYPTSNTWVASAKDHGLYSPASLTAYVVCISNVHIKDHPVRVVEATGTGPGPTSTALVAPVPGTQIIGGGARSNRLSPGMLLTAMGPHGPYWLASGKDHVYSSPGTVTGFAIVQVSSEPTTEPEKVGTAIREISLFADNGFTGNDQSGQWVVAPATPRPSDRYVLQWRWVLQQFQNVTRLNMYPGSSVGSYDDKIDVAATVHGDGLWGITGRLRMTITVYWQLVH